MLASTDIVAAEATAARVMQYEEAYVQRILTMAHEEGLGKIAPEKIELAGATRHELQIEWKPARLQFA